jgi:hypothetical protein
MGAALAPYLPPPPPGSGPPSRWGDESQLSGILEADGRWQALRDDLEALVAVHVPAEYLLAAAASR